MVRMMVTHSVTDYAAWRKAYDDFDPIRKEKGVIAAAVFQSVDNPNDLTITHDFETADAAKAFADSPELRSTMEKAGVAGPPTIWFVNETLSRLT